MLIQTFSFFFFFFQKRTCTFTGPDKLLNGQNLARIRISYTHGPSEPCKFFAWSPVGQKFWPARTAPLWKFLHSLRGQSVDPSSAPLIKKPFQSWDWQKFVRTCISRTVTEFARFRVNGLYRETIFGQTRVNSTFQCKRGLDWLQPRQLSVYLCLFSQPPQLLQLSVPLYMYKPLYSLQPL